VESEEILAQFPWIKWNSPKGIISELSPVCDRQVALSNAI